MRYTRIKWAGNVCALVLVVAIVLSCCTLWAPTLSAQAAGDYYAGITATQGTALLGQLHDLIVTTHSKYTSYNDCKDANKVYRTDPGSNSSSVMEFYSQADIDRAWGSGNPGTWNREHVWCQSRSNNLWGQSGGGSDMHHIRPSETRLNSTRGNHKYGEVGSGGKTAYYKDAAGNNIALGGYVDSGADIFEPLDNVKGDVARILFYVYTHYNTYTNVGGTTNGGGSASFGTLSFTNIVSASSESSAIDMLLRWNENDPVDDIERTRNDAVYSIQGNRNPYIDNEQYANAIWGGGTVGDTDGVRLSKSTLTMAVGDTYTLSATTTGEGTLSWSSSNSAVVSVQDGTLKALKEGTVTITAQFGSHSATCKVTVSNDLVLDTDQVTLQVGGQYTVSASATATVYWRSSNEEVATVQNGVITAVSAGRATITASCGTASATVIVYVEDGSQPVGDSITITRNEFVDVQNSYAFQKWSSGTVGGFAYMYGGNNNYMQFNKSKPYYYLASDLPTPNSITSITVVGNGTARDWQLLTSSKPFVQESDVTAGATDHGIKNVTEDGVTWKLNTTDKYFCLVYALGASSGAGYLQSVTVSYASCTPGPTPVDSITLDPTTLALTVGNSGKINATHSAGTVAWTSSNTAVATVAQDGTVTAVAAGTATITATLGTASATCTVTVTKPDDPTPVDSITLNPTTLALTVGNNGKINATHSAGTVAWTSSNTAVATVAQDGTVTAVAAGTATITATLGTASATCTVTVTKPDDPTPVDSITLDPTTLALTVGNNGKINATHSAGTVVWTSSNTAVATVAQDGTVTAVSAGTATITATLGTASATCTVTVTKPDDPTPPTPVDSEEFRNAVAAIDNAQTRPERFAAINEAIRIYNGLTTEQQAACADDYSVLTAAVNNYNAQIAPINQTMSQTIDILAAAVAAAATALCALAAALRLWVR